MIARRTQTEVEKMKRAGAVIAGIMNVLGENIHDGIKTEELNRIAAEYIKKAGGEPAFKGYQGYPKTICTSINEEVVHGIPSERTIKEGDIVGIDVGVRLNGYYADAARTFSVGKISDEAKHLIKTTEDSLNIGIQQCYEGNRLSDISHAIQTTAEKEGFSVVRRYVGHGIGRKMHEDPQIPNYGDPGHGPELKSGMVFAVEPMVNIGGFKVDVLDDKWTVVTADRKLSAHFEHTVLVTESEPEVMTLMEAA